MSPKSETASKRGICLETVERRMKLPWLHKITLGNIEMGTPCRFTRPRLKKELLATVNWPFLLVSILAAS